MEEDGGRLLRRSRRFVGAILQNGGDGLVGPGIEQEGAGSVDALWPIALHKSETALWREKRGELEPEDLSDNLVVQLGTVTEELNRAGMNTGHAVRGVEKRLRQPSPNVETRQASRSFVK